MKKVIAFALCLVLLCSMAAVSLAEEPVVFRRVYASEVSTLNYLTAGAQWEQEVGANVIDSLVEYDRYGKLIPGLALNWETSEDGLTWTFKLRPDAKWSDGKALTDAVNQTLIAMAADGALGAISTEWFASDVTIVAQQAAQ